MNRLRKLFTENAGLKLLSLALAVALWVAVGSDPVTEAAFRVPLEFINVPANLEVFPEQSNVQLWARGPSSAVRRATPSDFAIRVKVSLDPARERQLAGRAYALDPASVTAPAPLQVVDLIPSEVRVTFETTLSKNVPIVPQFSGDPAPGYRVKEFHVNPSELRIIGPASHVTAITAAATDPIDLTHLSDNKTLVTNIRVADPLVRLPRPGVAEVTVQIERSDMQSTGKK